MTVMPALIFCVDGHEAKIQTGKKSFHHLTAFVCWRGYDSKRYFLMNVEGESGFNPTNISLDTVQLWSWMKMTIEWCAEQSTCQQLGISPPRHALPVKGRSALFYPPN
jgi:hypothetical protein